MYRKTYAEINLKNIYDNVKKIKNNYSYKYYIGIVKANCYGHGIKSIKSIIDGGCNYLAVAMLEEALEIRKIYKNIPILCLGVIDSKYLQICAENNITITVNTIDYFNEIAKLNFKLNIHIKLNTGMNRLGISKKEELEYIYNNINNTLLYIEGIYTHIYNADSIKDTDEQFCKFYKICSGIDLKSIEIIHIAASDTITKYPKKDFINGIRLGIIMYGFSNDIELKSTFSLYSNIAQINEIDENDKLGYNGNYIPKCKEKIGVVQIGYADGITRNYKGSSIYINDKQFEIVGNICMDMLFVKIDDSVKLEDKVTILKDNVHIKQIANYLNTIPYEILCNISYRVPRIYKVK